MLSTTIPSAFTASTLRQSLAPSTALLRSMGHLRKISQQGRSFRLNLRSSYLDPTFQKEFRPRYRSVKNERHVETLDRMLNFNTNKDKPAANTEDLHVYDLINAIHATSTSTEPNAPATDSISKNITHEFTKSTAYGKKEYKRRLQQHQEKTTEPYYEIDPITNRRISTDSQAQDFTGDGKIAVKSFKESSKPMSKKRRFGYRFQFLESPASTAEPTPPKIIYALKDHLKGYRRAWDEQNENPDPVQEGLKSYDEKVDYESRRFYDCAGIAVDYSDPVQSGLKDYDNKVSDGKACPVSSVKKTGNADPAQDGLADYDIKASYRQGRPSEESGEQSQQQDPVSHAIKGYKSRTEEPVFVRSYDTKPDPLAESLDPVVQAIRQYENSDFYKQAQKKKQGEIVVKAIQDYEASFQHLPTKLTGRRLDQEKSVLEAIQEYKSTASEEKLNRCKSPESLDPVRNESREYKVATQAECNRTDAAPQQLDRSLQSIEGHQSAVFRGPLAETQIQRKCPVQEGLEEYDAKVNNYQKPSESGRRTVKSLAFATTPSADTEVREISKDTAEDLDLLRTSDIRAASGIIKGLGKETKLQKMAKRQQLEDAFGNRQRAPASADEAAAAEKHASRKLAEELRIEHSELLNHAAHAKGRINAKIAEVEAGWEPKKSEKKMAGNHVRNFPEELEVKWTSAGTGTEGLNSDLRAGQANETDPSLGLAPELFSRNPGTPRIETSLDRTTSQKTESRVAAQESAATAPIKFTFHTSDPRSNEYRLALKERRGKERDIVREVRNISEGAYGTIDSKYRQVTVPETASPEPESISQSSTDQKLDSLAHTPEPTLYKFLAYDPTMQSVSMAETTSVVPDSSHSLTPAEVLLRLSNPSKFFPHFQSLQSQGYEIVTGSGDVLVFRKVRSGTSVLPEVDTPSEAHEKSLAQERRRVTNPIDGMQSTPITGDFASPTGFVNYDLPRGSEVPFQSNIDVRREEPVFSGRRNWEDETEEDKPRATGRSKRLLVGAAWVAACSYAVGVVSEFFRTGGMDGKDRK